MYFLIYFHASLWIIVINLLYDGGAQQPVDFSGFHCNLGSNVVYINEEPTLLWHPWLMIVAVIVRVLISYGLTLLWEKRHFKYSVELLVDQIMARVMHRNLKNMDLHDVLYDGVERQRWYPLKEMKKQLSMPETVKE